MSISTNTEVPQPTTRPPFRFRDMLMPGPLLERTNWQDNPLVVYSQHRSRRPMRFAILRLIEFFLIAIPILLFLDVCFSEIWFGEYPWQNPYWQLFHAWFQVAILSYPFVLLRYHLVSNDQSHHIKMLSREHLGELLLTRLGNEEFFLHHFLMFCTRYRVLVAFFVLWGAVLVYEILSGRLEWVGERFWVVFMLMLSMLLLIWIVAVFQYVTEWNWFAGGKFRHFRFVLSMVYSLFLSGLCLAAAMALGLPMMLRIGSDWVQPIFLSITVPICAVSTYLLGVRVCTSATERLRSRYMKEKYAAAGPKGFTSVWDPIAPWRWFKRAESNGMCKSFAAQAVYAFFYIGLVIGLRRLFYRLPIFSPTSLSLILFSFLGIAFGASLAQLQEQKQRRRAYLDAIRWMFVTYIAVFLIGEKNQLLENIFSSSLRYWWDETLGMFVKQYAYCICVGLLGIGIGAIVAQKTARPRPVIVKLLMIAVPGFLLSSLGLSGESLFCVIEYLIVYILIYFMLIKTRSTVNS